MELKVLGWRCRNLRGGLRDMAIDFEGKPARWALIQMPNGLGKTTTMSLLRASFSGEVLAPETVRELRAADDVDDGSFEVRIAIDGKPFRIVLRLDFKTGAHVYWTSRSEVRNGGLEEGRHLPPQLKKLLTQDFTRLFVFDGELAKEIRDVGKDRATLAIRTLYGLDRLDALNVAIARLVAEKQRASAAAGQRAVVRWKKAYDDASARKAKLVGEDRKLRKGLDERRARLAMVIKEKDSRVEQDGSLKKRRDVLNKAGEAAERSIFEATVSTIAVLRAPARLHPRVSERLHSLGHRLTRLKLPKTISAEFFRELADQTHCVCGTLVSPPLRAAILSRSADYLAEDQVLVINKMKLALRETGPDTQAYASASMRLRNAVRLLNVNRAAQDRLELERIESGDTELEQLVAERAKIDREIESLEEKLECLNAKDAVRQGELGVTENDNIPLALQEMKRCKDKLAAATDTLRFVRQAERLSDIIARVSVVALDRLRERLRAATNEKLKRLVLTEPLQISRIGGSLELESRGHRRKGNVSEGQSLSVAYAFLTSLLAEAPCRLPFIVDSPAVSLDTAVRREVGDLIPGLFDQMIMFVISSEREGFADAFYARKGVRYVTLKRANDGSAEVMEGLKHFKSFQQVEAGA